MRYVPICCTLSGPWLKFVTPVTDMLVAVLNTCTKEELDEGDEEYEALASPASAASIAEDSTERRTVIKSKIMAVGRMARVFALLRYVCSLLLLLAAQSYLSGYPERNQKKSRNSRACRARTSFLMGHLHLARRGSRMLSVVSTTRMSLRPLLCSCLTHAMM